MILRWLPEDITVHNEDLEGNYPFFLLFLIYFQDLLETSSLYHKIRRIENLFLFYEVMFSSVKIFVMMNR